MIGSFASPNTISWNANSFLNQPSTAVAADSPGLFGTRARYGKQHRQAAMPHGPSEEREKIDDDTGVPENSMAQYGRTIELTKRREDTTDGNPKPG
jgi:hypothetical protein